MEPEGAEWDQTKIEEIYKIPIPIKSLKELNKDVYGIWYLTVDEDILLNNFDLIKDLMNKDDLCKLLISESMLKYIKLFRKGEHGGDDRVVFARQVYRELVTSIQVQIVDIQSGFSLTGDIVKCCVQAMDEDMKIVLITQNIGLKKKAKLFGVDNIYSLDDLKNDLTNPNERESTQHSKSINTEGLHQHSMSIDNWMNLRIYNQAVASIKNKLDAEKQLIDEDIKNNIILRYDEWICCFVQIMEYFIHNVLLINFKDDADMPYFLNEGLELLKKMYSNSKAIEPIIKLMAFERLFTMKDITKTYAEPNDFLKMLDCGFLLVEAFKTILSEDFSEIEDMLVNIFESIIYSKNIEELETVEVIII